MSKTKTIFKNASLLGHSLEETAAALIPIIKVQVGMMGRRDDIEVVKLTGEAVPDHPLSGVQEGKTLFVFGFTLSGPSDAFSANIRNDRIGRASHDAADDIRGGSAK